MMKNITKLASGQCLSEYDHAEVHRGSLIMTISDRHSKASLRKPHILSDALSGKSHQSLQPSFTALSSRAIFMFR